MNTFAVRRRVSDVLRTVVSWSDVPNFHKQGKKLRRRGKRERGLNVSQLLKGLLRATFSETAVCVQMERS